MPEDKVIKENIRLHKEKATNYEEDHPDIFNDNERRRISSTLDEAAQHIETDSSVSKALDVGCGTGNVLRKLNARFDKTYGMDLSDEMLCEAYQNMNSNGNSKLIRGKVSDLPFPDNSFDLVSAYSLFHHLPDFSDPASEISRVLKEGGVLYIDHEPMGRSKNLVKLYIKLCNILNGEFRRGFPPYKETEGNNREHCDYHIHHGENGGLPLSRVESAFEKEGLNIITTRKYLSYGSNHMNPFYPLFKPLIENEWLLIGKKV